MNSGVVFKWLRSNQNEIRNHRKNNGRTPNLQAHINKMHLKYIATRPGASLNEKAHGLFGYIYNPEKDVLQDCDDLDLENISKRVGNMSKEGIDVFKTVISLTEDDAINYGYTNRKSWKGLLEQKINEIAKYYKINASDLEWTASYHSESGHLHCHLLFWDRKQNDSNKMTNRMPFVNYKEIRKSLAKEVFKEDYKRLLKLKNVSRDRLFNITGKKVKSYYNEINQHNGIKIEDNELIENFLEEVMPEKIPKRVFSNKVRQTNIPELNEKLSKLEDFIRQENLKAINTDKINYRYGYQQPIVKEYIDEISTLILKTSSECQSAFKNYIDNYITVQKLIGDVVNNEDIERIKYLAKKEVFNKIGNEILKTIKKARIDENKRAFEKKRDDYSKRYNQYLDNKLEKNILYNKLLINDVTTIKTIEKIFYELSNMNISESAKITRLRKDYGNLSKQARKELAREKANSDGFEWGVE